MCPALGDKNHHQFLKSEVFESEDFKGLGTSTNQLVYLLVDCIEH
jgi:hypothetical protein